MKLRAGFTFRLAALYILVVVVLAGALVVERSTAYVEGCAIKGNISWTGERIYHLPGSRYYDETLIDAPQGEQWFCSIWDALKAGWRPAWAG